MKIQESKAIRLDEVAIDLEAIGQVNYLDGLNRR